MVTIKSVKNSISKRMPWLIFVRSSYFSFFLEKSSTFLIILVSFFFFYYFFFEGTGVRESEPNDLVKTCFSRRFRKCFLLLFLMMNMSKGELGGNRFDPNPSTGEGFSSVFSFLLYFDCVFLFFWKWRPACCLAAAQTTAIIKGRRILFRRF